MDYKEKYEKAVQAAILAKQNTESAVTIQILEDIFPELAESEDEQNLNAALGYIDDEYLRRWLKDAIYNKYEKPTWSEEDEIALSDALWCCKQAASIAKDENDMGNVWYAERWLKSLKDRYTWKPSEEQMEILQYLCETSSHPNEKVIPILESLYQDLKKLRE